MNFLGNKFESQINLPKLILETSKFNLEGVVIAFDDFPSGKCAQNLTFSNISSKIVPNLYVSHKHEVPNLLPIQIYV